MRTLLWFRGKDLRLTDHAPLAHALSEGEVFPVFVLDPYYFSRERAQLIPHRMQFLLESIAALEQNLKAKGSELFLFAGRAVDLIPQLCLSYRIDRVLAQAWVDPVGRARDAVVRKRLTIPFELYFGETLLPPGSLRTQAGTPYSVYTPFAQAFRRLYPGAAPLPAPSKMAPFPQVVKGTASLPRLLDLGIEENPHLVRGGEKNALARLKDFLRNRLAGYEASRDQLGETGTSRLSQDLKFGTVSVGRVWHDVEALPKSTGRDKFLSELLWREFSHSTLWDRRELERKPFRRDFIHFPYRDSDADYQAWASGNTGYPVVDAAQRQLLLEGYVHNRARMITASFLTKHLLIDYRRGEAHFMQYLVDGDLPQNNMGWQWSAGSGVDAQPYFRVFHPVTQGQKFDSAGHYVRRYVPEIASLPDRYLHAPWTAPAGVLDKAGIRLGVTYPLPIVDADVGRKRFLEVAQVHIKGRGVA